MYCYKIIRSALTVSAAAVLFMGNAGADEYRFMPRQYFSDVQSEALGECILAQPNSPFALLTNPAGTATLYRSKCGLMDVSLPDKVHHDAASVGIVTRYGNITGLASYRGYGDVKSVVIGNTTYDLKNKGDGTAILNYSLALKRELPYPEESGSVGLNIKYVRSEAGELSSENVLFDFGGTFVIPFVRNLSAGLVYRNIGGAEEFISNDYQVASEIEGGLRYDIPSWGGLHFVLDGGRDVSGGHTLAAAGVSISPLYPFTFRAGWRDNGQPLGSGFRGGIGMDFGALGLNYSVSPYFRGDETLVHRIGIEISFGGIVDEKKAYDHYLKTHFAIARDKYERRDYIGARQELEDILSVYPDDQLSKEYLEKIGQSLDDIEMIKEVEVNRWLRRAVVAMTKKDYIRARTCYNRILKIDSENAAAHEGIAKLEEYVNEARQVSMRKENDEKIKAMFNEALALYQRGDYVVAKEKFQDLLAIDPENQQIISYVKDIDAQMAKVTAIQINGLFVKGMELYNNENYKEAMKYFSAVAIASPDRTDAQDYLAKCQNIIEQEEAKTTSAEALQKQEKIKEAVAAAFDNAMKLYESGSYEEALKAFAKSSEIAARYDNEKYVEESRKYIVNSKNAISEKHYRNGVDYAQRNKLESAAYAYRESLRYNPDNMSAKVELDRIAEKLAQDYFEAGMNNYSKGNTDKAKEYFKKSLYYKPDKVEVLRALERIR